MLSNSVGAKVITMMALSEVIPSILTPLLNVTVEPLPLIDDAPAGELKKPSTLRFCVAVTVPVFVTTALITLVPVPMPDVLIEPVLVKVPAVTVSVG